MISATSETQVASLFVKIGEVAERLKATVC
jgi:hypothetical protein